MQAEGEMLTVLGKSEEPHHHLRHLARAKGRETSCPVA
jgi:hypothetical protein